MNNTSKFGVNILIYSRYSFGITELSRLILACLEYAKIPYVINNLEERGTLNAKTININSKNIYPINVIVISAREMNLIIKKKGINYLKNKYNIGVWCWETEYFPEVPNSILNYINEVWTISEFCKSAINKTINLPVNVIKLPVILPKNISFFTKIDRKKFVILFMFDHLSIPERKNPLGVITAFKTAFGHNPNVLLVIKTTHGIYKKKYLKTIKESIQTHKNIMLFDQCLSRSDTLSLINSCDVYLSLHRSEGLGLCLKEAMGMGKIVIATNYSGNLDFMSHENSLLVKYDKVQIPLHVRYYYHEELMWADPDISDAVNKLKYVYENHNLREIIKIKAKKSIEDNYNIAVCSNDISSKIKNIRNYLEQK